MGGNDNDQKRRDLWIEFAGRVILFFCVVALISLLVHNCSTAKKQSAVSPGPTLSAPAPNSPVFTACADGSAPGSMRTEQCASGQTGSDVQVCAGGTWKDAVNTCVATPQPPAPPTGCPVSVFSDVAPIFASNCVSCHAGLTSFAGVTALADPAEISRRVGLPATDADHMPEQQAPQLSSAQIATVQKWVSDGANNLCPSPTPTNPNPPPPGPAVVTSDALNQLAIQDATSLGVNDRSSTIYLSAAGAVNAGISGTGLQVFTDAMNKALNHLNVTTQNLVKAQNIGTGLWRVDIRNYGISQAGLTAIENADILNFVDNSSKGQILQALLGRKHTIFEVDDFVETAFGNPTVYYTLTNIPAKLSQYQQQIGVNFAQDLARLPTNPATGQAQLAFIGAVGQITINKNRLIVRDVQANGSGNNSAYYQTFDVNAQPHFIVSPVNGGQVDTKNLHENPLLAGTGAQTTAGSAVAVYTQDASETIRVNPNGTLSYGLWDAAGNRLNAADPNVVIDTTAAAEGFSEVISVGLTCSQCHNAGFIPLVDTTLASVTANADQFFTSDVQLAQAVYHNAKTNSAMFAGDVSAFNATLAKFGEQPGADPLNTVGNRFEGPWDLTQLAATLRISTDDATTCINGSAKTKAAIGGILSGQEPASDVFAALPQLIVDCDLFQDPVAQ